MTESVRLYWVSTMHHFASVHQAMSAVTKTLFQTSEQHVEIGNSRMRRDADDLQKVCNWFSQFNPFDTSDHRLCSLSGGLVAMPSDGINCDNAEVIGRAIQESLDNKIMTEVSIPRKQQIKNLVHLNKSIVVDNQKVHINPSILFMRLVVIIERETETEKYFNYKLTAEPTSLFKCNFMRHPDKSSLAATLKGVVPRNYCAVFLSEIDWFLAKIVFDKV